MRILSYLSQRFKSDASNKETTSGSISANDTPNKTTVAGIGPQSSRTINRRRPFNFTWSTTNNSIALDESSKINSDTNPRPSLTHDEKSQSSTSTATAKISNLKGQDAHNEVQDRESDSESVSSEVNEPPNITPTPQEINSLFLISSEDEDEYEYESDFSGELSSNIDQNNTQTTTTAHSIPITDELLRQIQALLDAGKSNDAQALMLQHEQLVANILAPTNASDVSFSQKNNKNKPPQTSSDKYSHPSSARIGDSQYSTTAQENYSKPKSQPAFQNTRKTTTKTDSNSSHSSNNSLSSSESTETGVASDQAIKNHTVFNPQEYNPDIPEKPDQGFINTSNNQTTKTSTVFDVPHEQFLSDSVEVASNTRNRLQDSTPTTTTPNNATSSDGSTLIASINNSSQPASPPLRKTKYVRVDNLLRLRAQQQLESTTKLPENTPATTQNTLAATQKERNDLSAILKIVNLLPDKIKNKENSANIVIDAPKPSGDVTNNSKDVQPIRYIIDLSHEAFTDHYDDEPIEKEKFFKELDKIINTKDGTNKSSTNEKEDKFTPSSINIRFEI